MKTERKKEKKGAKAEHCQIITARLLLSSS